MPTLRKILDILTDVYIMPRTCPVCGSRLEDNEKAMCTACLIKLPVCHERGPEIFDMRSAVSNASVLCGMVQAWFHYDPASQYAVIIRTAKYRDTPSLAYELGHLFARDLKKRLPENTEAGPMHVCDIDVLLPMPMHFFKRIRRGYNQAEELARGMGDELGIPVADNLIALKPHSTQTRLSYRKRTANLRGTMAVNDAHELRGMNVGIVDDIITTGSSMTEAAVSLSWSMPHMDSLSFLALGLTRKKN